MKNDFLVEIKNLDFSYPNGRKIFNQLNFSLRRGERVAITGSNGSGKTTLFNLIMGLLTPQNGEIKIFGKVRKTERDFFEVRERIGLLFQDSDDQLFCPTVEEDIAFGPLNLGKSTNEVKQIIKETCYKLGISGLEKRVTHTLSGGEKRIVALATIVAMNPECFLFDEPITGLDETSTEKVVNFLRNKAETFVLISYDRNFVERVVDKIYIIKNKRIESV